MEQQHDNDAEQERLRQEIIKAFETLEGNHQFLYDLLKEVDEKLKARPYMGEFVLGADLRERIQQAVAQGPDPRWQQE